jgi:hypothetical protein
VTKADFITALNRFDSKFQQRHTHPRGDLSMQGYQQPPTHLLSPQKLYAGSVANFASSFDTNSTRGILKEDLVKRVVFDRDEVLTNVLGILRVPNDTVNRLVTNLSTTHRTHFDDLKKAIRLAEERKMYPPLVS